jgi:hypothetical protein
VATIEFRLSCSLGGGFDAKLRSSLDFSATNLDCSRKRYLLTATLCGHSQGYMLLSDFRASLLKKYQRGLWSCRPRYLSKDHTKFTAEYSNLHCHIKAAFVELVIEEGVPIQPVQYHGSFISVRFQFEACGISVFR